MTGNLTVPNLITAGNVDGRDVSADGTKLDGIEAGATADQTAAELLTAIKTVDGAASGLDADFLDGQHGSYYYPAANPSGYTANAGTVTSITAGAGLSGGVITGSGTVSHADTSSQASVNNSGSTYIQGVTLDAYGHVTGLTSTTVSATAPTTAQVLAATAGASVGAVGTYAMLWRYSGYSSNTAPGTNIAGSQLRYSNSEINVQYSTYGYGATSPSGTWRLMGNLGVYNGGNTDATINTQNSIYLRIA